MSNSLGAGGRLSPGESLGTRSGNAHLRFLDNGDLVLLCDRATGRQIRWHSDTAEMGGTEVVLLDDATLVIRNEHEQTIWRSGITTPPALTARVRRDAPGAGLVGRAGEAKLVVHENENVEIFLGARVVWTTDTSLEGTVITDPQLKRFFLVGPGMTRNLIHAEDAVDRFGGLGHAQVLAPEQLRRWKAGATSMTRRHGMQGAAGLRLCVDRKPAVPVALPPRQSRPGPPKILPDGSIAPGVARQTLATEPDKLWEIDGTLRVKIFGGTALIRRKIREIAEEWSRYANIHFRWVDADQSAEIRVNCNSDGRSHSVVGRDALGVPFDFATMNFGWFTDKTPETEFRRVILHEFGHALGFIHEHQSPAAGIAWDKPKVYDHYWSTEKWDRGMVDQNVLTKYDAVTTNYSAFDPDSIMLYPVPADLTLDGWSQGLSATDLSATDREYARRWYPDTPTPTNANGQIRTGDGDLIDFNVEYGVGSGDNVEFILRLNGGLSWWKAIEIPVGSTYQMMWVQDSVNNASLTIPLNDLDLSRGVRFWKAKVFGVHTLLPFRWDVLAALPAGSRVTLAWVDD